MILLAIPLLIGLLLTAAVAVAISLYPDRFPSIGLRTAMIAWLSISAAILAVLSTPSIVWQLTESNICAGQSLHGSGATFHANGVRIDRLHQRRCDFLCQRLLAGGKVKLVEKLVIFLHNMSEK